MIPGNASPLLLATAADAAAAAVATKSLRFTSGDSSFLNRTPSSAGNRKKFTYSLWVKRCTTGSRHNLFSTVNASTQERIQLGNNDTIDFIYSQGTANVSTTAVFRDLSAWYHIVFAVDTDQSTAADRVKLYVNGAQQTLSGTFPSSGASFDYNNTKQHRIGSFDPGTGGTHFADCYFADIFLIDGSQLEPTSFGAYDDSGVWQSAAYSGTFGTNGFHLAFGDSSSNAALGTDSSGNSNTWTVNNLVASAPATAKGGFDVVTYTGNGSSQSISSLAFQPDLVWVKNRTVARNNNLFDSIRGTDTVLSSNLTDAESGFGGTGYVTAFNSDGFTVGAQSSVNESSQDFVAWCWKAGGTAVSNTDGTITSSVSASTEYGFSCVSYTGTGANATVGHGLNTTPKWIVAKTRDSAVNWIVYHDSLGSQDFLRLNSTATTDNNSTVWNTEPTSSVFGVGSANGVNQSGDDYIAYCWSEVPGFSSFGSYEGDGDGTGPDVTTGFKPKYVIIKNIDEAAGWRIYDTVRGTSKVLKPNTSDSELSTGDPIVFLSDGFRLTGTANEETNKSGKTYIYAAFSGEPPGDLVDSLFDVPTNGTTNTDSGAGGEISGNYAVFNALEDAASGGNAALSNGNLQIDGSSSEQFRAATIPVTSGKWYFEIVQSAGTDFGPGVWAYPLSTPSSAFHANENYRYNSNGGVYDESAKITDYSSFAVGDVIGTALDMDNGKVYFSKNGTWQNSGDPAAGTNPAATGLTGQWVFGASTNGNSTTLSANFGQRAFAYTAPSGYKALCTTNLPTPTIADGSDYFEAKLYTGNGSTNTITGLEFSPDWTWIKKRNSNSSHSIHDTVRGATKRIRSESADAETTESTALTAFTSDGFTLGSGGTANGNNDLFVSWNWDAGSSTVSNTDGSGTSSVQVRANTTAGFSIVTYRGGSSSPANSDSGDSFGHGLGVAPDLVICKKRTGSNSWPVYHRAAPTGALILNATNANDSSSFLFAKTDPTSTEVFLGNNPEINNSSHDYVAYCFAPVAGYSSFGSYEGNGSSDGPFVHTGFRIRWLMIKAVDYVGSDASQNFASWLILDTARDPFNVSSNTLWANKNAAEDKRGDGSTAVGSLVDFDILSNGFKLRQGNVETNRNGITYVYAAFSENAFSLNGGLAR